MAERSKEHEQIFSITFCIVFGCTGGGPQTRSSGAIVADAAAKQLEKSVRQPGRTEFKFGSTSFPRSTATPRII